jgi:hypothetical protein
MSAQGEQYFDGACTIVDAHDVLRKKFGEGKNFVDRGRPPLKIWCMLIVLWLP